MKSKFLAYIAVAFVAFFVISSPVRAADVASSIGGNLGSAGTSLGNFFAALTDEK